eukprot:maker-scaffold50_size457468-snap-gene-0.19 protein:Tk03200 transcript:maker-scaffold50_size457468-snap-gene-0.19-mRNA-1 annotation:"structural maintenance of chromosomes protein 5-like"
MVGPCQSRGAIEVIALENFMQYDQVSFRPGPHLNVILGPNGSGKSSIVNAICLGLNGQPSSLGRASHIREFIRLGCERAQTAITLHNPEDETGWTILRQWDVSGRSQWRINGQSVTQKEVDKLIRELNIQTDNLCQFLPQDKVHEFSRMNPREMLTRTIEAVGESQLRRDHDKLKNLQSEIQQGVAIQESRRATLLADQRKLETLEHLVQNFKDKEEKQGRLGALRKKKAYLEYQAEKQTHEAAKARYEASAKRLTKEEAKLQPLKNKRGNLRKERDRVSAKIRASVAQIRDNIGKAKTRTEKIENMEEELETLEAEIEDLMEKEQKKGEALEQFKLEIMNLERERDEADKDESVEPQIKSVQRDINAIHQDQANIQDGMRQSQFEMSSLRAMKKRVEDEISELRNVENQKLEILKSLPNGPDALKAMQWLMNNRTMFQGRIYDPIVTQINVIDPEDAVYLENTIPFRELVAFVAEDVEDMNQILRQFRDIMKLKVNVVHSDPNEHPDQFQPARNEAPLRPIGFRGWMKDCFTAPDGIKAFLCKTDRLQDIAMFDASAEKNLEKIVEEHGVASFFVGKSRYRVTTSRYSGQKATTSFTVTRRNVLNLSADQSRELDLNARLKDLEDQARSQQGQSEEFKKTMSNSNRELEAKKLELKKLKEVKDYRNVLNGKLAARRKQMQRFIDAQDNTDTEKVRIETRKQRLVVETLRAAHDLKTHILESNRRKVSLEVDKIEEKYLNEYEEHVKLQIEEAEQELAEIREHVEAEKSELRHVEQEFRRLLENAQGIIGNHFPQELRQIEAAFQAHGLPESIEDIELLVEDLDNQVQCLEDTDPRVISNYQSLLVSVQDVEAELANFQKMTDEKRADIETTRQRWLADLLALVDRISQRFSHFFETMGFAGSVVLNRGAHEHDYYNYGIDIMVKYRTHLPLQRLDPHQQSGGERSVATALYMLALQELTVVPFRCVDEINQGMDAVNERRVFDLLVQTSCHERSAQYFLLTPKLLPDLNYDENMSVLVVHNGQEMVHHSEWDMEAFIQKAIGCAS